MVKTSTRRRTGGTPAYKATTPVRQVRVGDVSLAGLDTSTTIEHSATGTMGFECTIYNMSPTTWSRIATGDRVEIGLGWKDMGGPPDPIFVGTVGSKDVARRGGDTHHHLRGESLDSAKTRTRVSNTWNDSSLETIVRDMAGFAGLSVGDISTPAPRYTGYWSIQDTRTLHAWLRDLVRDATEKTGTHWHWHVANGELSVVRRDDTDIGDGRVLLHRTGSLQSLTAVSGDATLTDATDELIFTAYLEPGLSKANPVIVMSRGAELACRVVSYRFESSSITGRHRVKGRLVPMTTDFDVNTLTDGGGR